MIEQFAEELYKSTVEENMKLYRQFFLYDPNEEGTIEYWKNAIAFTTNWMIRIRKYCFLL